ncbi:MAG: class I SAM-dependent methyltransferase [Candidatus Marinarcus sp.]|uniref:class I SAM-dependent methyltransferase n=1 Tax=Candidatus Marinarcus sp. TaxID=3100987 RepID=UPI003B00D9CA
MNVQKHKGATDPQSFDQIVREVFAPIYPVIAQQIIQKSLLTQGKCLDAGCGTGALGRALAKATQMHIIFFDQSEKMLELSKKYVQNENLTNRSSFLNGDIHNIPYENESLDLVISRGSLPFWDDWAKAYGEIFRILKKGGQGYIGCGFGTEELRHKIMKTMKKNNPNWKAPVQDSFESKKATLPQIIETLNPSTVELIDDKSGFWVYIKK